MARHANRKADQRPRSQVDRASYEYPVYAPGTLSLERVDLSARADRDTYDDDLRALQEKVYALHIETYLQERRALIVFEGWDAAGKGGAIKRLTAMMDPRGFKVWPIAAPRDEEKRNHYLWRFWERAPQKGEIAIFDRSWYGRVLVERVEGYARKPEWSRAYGEICTFEKTLADDGVRIVKFFLHIDRKTQLQRFEQRKTDPLKQYKLGPDDWRNRKRWKDYEAAIGEMLDRTHTPFAPWVVVPSKDKKLARLTVLREVVKLLG
jgi:polyphosphate kinase 2 (PPK2 family)